MAENEVDPNPTTLILYNATLSVRFRTKVDSSITYNTAKTEKKENLDKIIKAIENAWLGVGGSTILNTDNYKVAFRDEDGYMMAIDFSEVVAFGIKVEITPLSATLS